MERLLYSPPSTPLKTHLKRPSPLLPRLSKLESPKLGFPSLTRPGFRRVNSVSCKYENPSTPPLQVDSSTGSTPKSNFVKQIVGGVSVKSKTLKCANPLTRVFEVAIDSVEFHCTIETALVTIIIENLSRDALVLKSSLVTLSSEKKAQIERSGV
ncbi:hypothetical protein D5086_009141 [Populus alba]|uniref:Uncharacterized protein n=1 Tax=Populus alba TaxID=43335 RepID=A0ACC4CIX1_POPAL